MLNRISKSVCKTCVRPPQRYNTDSAKPKSRATDCNNDDGGGDGDFNDDDYDDDDKIQGVH